MNFIYKIMGVDKKPDDKYKYIWFTMGTACFALATLVMTIIISRLLGETQAGMFSVGLSIAQWLVTIAYFEIRTFQVTDVRNEYSFKYYLTLRILMCIITFLASIVYVVFNNYDIQKVIIILLVCLYKISDSIADTFEGEFQKEDRIDISGKSEFYRVFFSILVLVIAVAVSKNLILSLIIMNVVAYGMIVLLDISIAVKRVSVRMTGDMKRLWKLVKMCIPLAVSTFLSTYIINSSKLSVDRVLGDEAQLYYTAVFMPNMVINLFSGIIFKPMQTAMAVNYYEKKYKNFWHIISKMILIITGFTFVCEVGAYVLGIPVLSWLYGVNLKEYKLTLLLLLLCGGINAINIIFYYVLAIMRKQKYMTILYIIVCLVSFLIMDTMTGRMGLMGASLGYLILVSLLAALLLVYIIIQTRRNTKNE
jgi:O-antigen/teichoic acid export membrane protein